MVSNVLCLNYAKSITLSALQFPHSGTALSSFFPRLLLFPVSPLLFSPRFPLGCLSPVFPSVAVPCPCVCSIPASGTSGSFQNKHGEFPELVSAEEIPAVPQGLGSQPGNSAGFTLSLSHPGLCQGFSSRWVPEGAAVWAQGWGDITPEKPPQFPASPRRQELGGERGREAQTS